MILKRGKSMAISDEIINYWASPPGDAKAQEAYRQIGTSLRNSNLLTSRNVDVYLQGSYRNHTHIKEDSDVDIVAELRSTFYYDIDKLNSTESSIFHNVYSSSPDYGYQEFRTDVGNILSDKFGPTNVTEGSKCFKIKGNSQRSDADVLPCLEHRKYLQFKSYSRSDQRYLSGIKFNSSKDGWIINWPKIHYQNGVLKNKATDEKFKPLVRVYKNIKSLLIETNIINSDLAPSYFVECLVFNVPNNYFNNDTPDNFRNTLTYLQSSDISLFLCVNLQDFIFYGKNSWNTDNAISFLEKVSLIDRIVNT